MADPRDPYAQYAPKLDDPATRGFAITPSDTTDLDTIPRFIWVGGAGAISLIPVDQSAAITLSGIPAGTLLRIRARRVNATGTTATLITGLV